MLYLDPSVSRDKLLKMLKTLKELGTEVHQFALCKDEKLLVQLSPEPYAYTDKQVVFSVSKSFTSTAVGLCYDRGLIKPEDSILRFFPEELTAGADARLKKLKVHDLLTMHLRVADFMPDILRSEDPLKTFFSHSPEDVTDEFHYANMATFLLSAIVQSVTGLTVLDLLTKDFFCHLGIDGYRWISVGGITEGFSGLYLSAGDVAKAMQVYLHGGTFGGRRLLSREWVDLATGCQISTADDNPYRWWTQGYGYQFWRNPNGFCRAEGAAGQKGYVFPEFNVTCAHEGIFKSEDESNDAIYAFCGDFAGSSSVSEQELARFLAEWYAPRGGEGDVFPPEGRTFRPNEAGATSVRFRKHRDRVECLLSDGYQTVTLKLGLGQWCVNRYWGINPALGKLVDDVTCFDLTEFAASCSIESDGRLKVRLRFLNSPLSEELTVSESDGTLTVTVEGTDRKYTAAEIR